MHKFRRANTPYWSIRYGGTVKEINSRQTFLGNKFLSSLDQVRVGVVGLGGGGSIVISSLAYIGFKRFFICDPDNFEESNMSRLLGAHNTDIKNRTPKVNIAERALRSVDPSIELIKKRKIWQECIESEEMKECRIIFSCLDDFSNRIQLESFTRKNGIVLIDIGLTIKSDTQGNFYSMGQVVMSHPEGPCFKCLEFIADNDLALEASKYGESGIRPQVIWANSILANTAVGIGVEILSKWTGKSPKVFYRHFDGNQLILFENLKVKSGYFKEKKCNHFCH